MRYLLDTNVVSDFVRGEAAVIARLQQEAPSNLALSVTSELEIEYGLQRVPQIAVRVASAMRQIIEAVILLPFEREDAKLAAVLRNQLAAAGKPISPYDLLLAATALGRGLVFVTHNAREFERVPGLNLEDWRE